MKELLTKLEYKPITDFSLYEQKRLFSILGKTPEGLTIYAKTAEKFIEFSDENNKKLWSTKLSLVVFILLKNNQLFDKFIVPFYPFHIRNEYEVSTLFELYEQLGNELAEFDNFIPETEEKIMYDA